MSEPVQLGPFELVDEIGEGGMGIVYRGRHRGTGVPVAVKVVREASDSTHLRRFHREVQAQAGLLHPGIVYLFEYGEVGEGSERPSVGALAAGSPYVAMELAEGGSVRDAMPLSDWPTVRRLLVQILDALAHAHARGVVHRDLKPGNFLVFDAAGGSGPDWRVKLADFGIAHALGMERDEKTSALESAAGTPYYIAPEQVRGQWRRYGPWTDLYAVGCVAWELVCGRPPFDGESGFKIALRHETEPRPPLAPRFPVPGALEAWIHRAMAIEPGERFRRAADALWALSQMDLQRVEANAVDRPPADPEAETVVAGEAGGSEARIERTSPIVPAETVTLTAAARTIPRTLESTAPPSGPTGDADRERSRDGRDEKGRLEVRVPPPIPRDWRPDETDPLPAPLVGTGLGLFGVREPPFVNRREECSTIWSALREAVEEQSSRLVLIEGEAGTGKSRLAEWMATRAHEVGAARIVRVAYTRSGGPNEGFRGALERTLRTMKMERREVFEHLREALPPLSKRGDDEGRRRDARALTEYLRPTEEGAAEVDGPRHRFESVDQRRALLARTLSRLARERPVVLWLDDLQWGEEALGVLEYLRDVHEEPPVALVLATLRTDVVAERERLADRIAKCEALDGSSRLEIGPLSVEDQRRLLVDLLPLEDELAESLAERTEGNPLFAMQLLGHWIDRGDLEVGEEGFRASSGREPEVPESIHGLWLDRLERWAGTHPSSDAGVVVQSLERAAALGREVDDDEWRAVCNEMGVGPPERLRDGLVERGLAERTETGWSFAHGLLVDSLERRAREGGRWRYHHRRCAELLDELYTSRTRGTAARRAEHWIAAGELERALEPLGAEADRRKQLGDDQGRQPILERREQIFDELGISAADPRRIDNDIRLRRVQFNLGSTPNDEWTEKIRERAEEAENERLLAKAWSVTSQALSFQGDHPAACDAARRAAKYARQCDDTEIRIRALGHWGWSEYVQGNLDAAEEKLFEARARASETGELYQDVILGRILGRISVSRGAHDLASQRFEKSLKASRRRGYGGEEMRCLNALGEVARYEGDADTARRRYREYRRLARERNRSDAVGHAQANLCQVELMAGRLDVAEEYVRRGERQFEKISRRSEKVDLLRLMRLALAAGRREWSQFDELLGHYADGWPEDARLLNDHPWLLEVAGRYAAEAGEDERAGRAWRLARELWERLGDTDAIDEVDEKLEQLNIGS